LQYLLLGEKWFYLPLSYFHSTHFHSGAGSLWLQKSTNVGTYHQNLAWSFYARGWGEGFPYWSNYFDYFLWNIWNTVQLVILWVEFICWPSPLCQSAPLSSPPLNCHLHVSNTTLQTCQCNCVIGLPKCALRYPKFEIIRNYPLYEMLFF
jgi:hypothetical protein